MDTCFVESGIKCWKRVLKYVMFLMLSENKEKDIALVLCLLQHGVQIRWESL